MKRPIFVTETSQRENEEFFMLLGCTIVVLMIVVDLGVWAWALFPNITDMAVVIVGLSVLLVAACTVIAGILIMLCQLIITIINMKWK